MSQRITLPNKLTSASAPWGRQVSDNINGLGNTVDNFIADQTNKNRANNTNIQTLTTTQGALQEQQDYQASLVTISTTGSDFLVSNIPGDQTNRWYDGVGDTSVIVNVPTGRLLVGWGAGSVESRAGNSTMYAMMRIMLTAPSGWTTNLGSATRTFVTSGTTIGMPFASERTFDGVPMDEPITIRVQFGTWSAASGPLAGASFLTPFVRAQVVPAV